MKKTIITMVMVVCSYCATASAQEWSTPEALRAFGKPGDTVRDSASAPTTPSGKKNKKYSAEDGEDNEIKMQREEIKKIIQRRGLNKGSAEINSKKVVRTEQGYDKNFISHLSNRDQELFDKAYNSISSSDTEFYRNVKAIQFYRVIDSSNGTLIVLHSNLLYTGEIQKWTTEFYCRSGQVGFVSLNVLDLSFDKKDGRTADRITKKDPGMFEKMILDRVCR